jgi:hypothetical protein
MAFVIQSRAKFRARSTSRAMVLRLYIELLLLPSCMQAPWFPNPSVQLGKSSGSPFRRVPIRSHSHRGIFAKPTAHVLRISPLMRKSRDQRQAHAAIGGNTGNGNCVRCRGRVASARQNEERHEVCRGAESRRSRGGGRIHAGRPGIRHSETNICSQYRQQRSKAESENNPLYQLLRRQSTLRNMQVRIRRPVFSPGHPHASGRADANLDRPRG